MTIGFLKFYYCLGNFHKLGVGFGFNFNERIKKIHF